MKLIAQITVGIVLGAFAFWFLLGIAMSSDKASPAIARLGCNDTEVISAANQQLAEWLDQKIIEGADLHLNGHLVTSISTSTSIGDLQGTQECSATVSIGFRDEESGALWLLAPTNIIYHLDPTGTITFNDASLLDSAGAYEVTANLLSEESQRELAH